MSFRSIFCVLCGSDDYLDCFEKLLRLPLKKTQQREIVHVLLDCCAQEKPYNPYYSHVALKLCEAHASFKFTFQLSYWDMFKDIDDMPILKLSNTARLLSLLFRKFCLSMSILKVHYTLYTIHHTPYTILTACPSSRCTTHYTPYTILTACPSSRCTIHYTPYTILTACPSSRCTIHYTLYIIHYTLYTIHYTPTHCILKVLNVPGCNIGDLDLAIIAPLCSVIEALNLADCMRVTDKGVVESVAVLSQLRALNLRWVNGSKCSQSSQSRQCSRSM
jgi:hypothetical protein